MMESDTFFGFDGSIPPEDSGLSEGEDGEYDALNDETFGAAANDGDWEEGHEQMVHIREVQRRSRNDYEEEINGEERLAKDLQSLLVNEDNEYFGGRSIPGSHFNLSEANMIGSPTSTIWTPSPGVDKLPSSQPHRVVSMMMGESPGRGGQFSHIGGSPGGVRMTQLGPMPQMGGSPVSSGHIEGMVSMPQVKTVAELEDEMRCQQIMSHKMAQLPTHFGGGRVLTAEELERELTQPQQTPTRQAPPGQPPISHPIDILNMPPQGLMMTSPPGVLKPRPMMSQQHSMMGNGVPPQMRNMPPPFHLINRHANPPPPPHMHPRPGLLPHPPPRMFAGFNGPPPPLYNFSSRNEPPFLVHNGFPRNNDWGGNQERRSFDHRGMERMREEDQPQGRVRRDSEAEWDEWQRIRENDEYAGLMTPREKNWLRNIQSMQLHTETPYLDDYYYVMYSVKRQRKTEAEVIPLDRHLLPEAVAGGKDYEPPRMENSLGRLQAASVNAPRRIMDLNVVNVDQSVLADPVQAEMRRQRHMLLRVEKMYGVMMELDDLQRKIRVLPDCPTRDTYRDTSHHLVERLWDFMAVSEIHLVQMLSIRKGKTLLGRLLPWLQDERKKLVSVVLGNLPVLAKKDIHDQLLVTFWSATDRYLTALTTVELVEVATNLVTDVAHKVQHWSWILNNKFGLSVILLLLVKGEQESECVLKIPDWQEFLASLVVSLASPESHKGSTSDITPLPSTLGSGVRPSTHLDKCSGVETTSLIVAKEKLRRMETAIVVSE